MNLYDLQKWKDKQCKDKVISKGRFFDWQNSEASGLMCFLI